MARVQIPFAVQDNTGASLNGASVTVKIRDTNTLATLWIDETTASAQTNPVSTVSGRIPAWVDPGSYDLTITGPNFSGTRTFEAVRGDAALTSKVFRTAHTWTFTGVVAPETGITDLTNYFEPFALPLAASQTAQVVGYKCSIGGGTSATVKITKNGVDLTGFTGIVVTTTRTLAAPTAQPLANNDDLKLVVTAATGSPANLSFTLFLEHTV